MRFSREQARPPTRPSPPGEGETLLASGFIPAAGLIDGLTSIQRRDIVNPLPGGEGRVRAGNVSLTNFGSRVQSAKFHLGEFAPRPSPFHGGEGRGEKVLALDSRLQPFRSPTCLIDEVESGAVSGCAPLVNEPRLALNAWHRSDSLGVESVGTTSANGGNALFQPRGARAALLSSWGNLKWMVLFRQDRFQRTLHVQASISDPELQ